VQKGSHSRAGGQHPDARHRVWLAVGWWPGSKGTCEERQRGEGRDTTRVVLVKRAIFSQCIKWLPAPDIPNLA